MANKTKAKVEFEAVTSKFEQGIKGAESELKTLRSELKLNSTELKGAADNTDLLQNRYNILSRELEVAKKKVELTSQKLVEAKRIYGENSNEVTNLTRQLTTAKTVEASIQNEIKECTDKLKQQNIIFKENTGKIKINTEAIKNLGEKFESAGKKATLLSGGIVAISAGAIASFNAVDEGADNAIAKTGAMGEQAKQLENNYKNVASAIVGDFGDIGNTLGEVNTRFGFIDKQLEDATIKFIKFANVNKIDATTAVQLVSRSMGDASIEATQYSSILDILTKASQMSGISINNLAENITKYGAPMRALGFDIQESIALFSSWEKAGVNTEIAFSGMKKAISNWGSAGKDSRKEFKKTLDEIAKCPDIAKATTKAIEIFGAKAGPDLADAIKGGRFSYQELLTELKNSTGALDGTFDGMIDGGYQADLTIQNAKMTMSELGNTLLVSLSPFLESATEKLQEFTSWWNGLSSGAQQTILVIIAVIAAIGPAMIIIGNLCQLIGLVSKAFGALNLVMSVNPIFLIIAAIVALIAIFVVLWNKCEGFRKFWINLWNGIVSFVQSIISGLVNFFGLIWEKIIGVFRNLGTRIGDAIGGAVKAGINGIFGMIENTINFWIGLLNGAIGVINLIPGVNIPNLEKLQIPRLKAGIDYVPNDYYGPVYLDEGERVLTKEENREYSANHRRRLQGILDNRIGNDVALSLTFENQQLIDAINRLANRKIYLEMNGKELARATATDNDNVNGLV